jgi:hypothetical protein
MNRRSYIISILTILSALLLAGCFPQQAAEGEPAGFFKGIWHGWIAPISLIFGFFDQGIRIYETNNTGWWYDLGYYMAVISGFGSIALSRRQHSSGQS